MGPTRWITMSLVTALDLGRRNGIGQYLFTLLMLQFETLEFYVGIVGETFHNLSLKGVLHRHILPSIKYR